MITRSATITSLTKEYLIFTKMNEKPQRSKQEENNTQQRLLAKTVQLRQHIQQRLAGKPLPPPEEIISKMREERTQELLDSLKD